MLVLSLFTDVMNHKPRFAWELYLKMETSGESFSLLQLIANDCYKVLYVLCVTFTQCLNRSWEGHDLPYCKIQGKVKEDIEK